MNRYIQEIIDTHVLIEKWLGKREGTLEVLLSRFGEDFTMIAPTGACLDYAAVAAFFASQGAGRPGLKIALDALTVVTQWENGAVVNYRETQTRPDQPVNVRWSTAVLHQNEGAITWRLLHETAHP